MTMTGALTMGRNRKPGRRKPCGRLVQDTLENRGGVVAVRRLLDHLLVVADDPAIATVFGRMYINREISAAAYNAACKFAVLRAKADHALGIPARNPKALAFGEAGGLSLAHEDAEYTASIVAAFDAAEIAIGLGTLALSAVEDVVIYDQQLVGYAQKLALKAGLGKLVVHWQLSAIDNAPQISARAK